MRLINADALKKVLGEWIIAHYTDTFTGDDAGLVFAHLIDRAETIDIGKGDKIMKWIPCTERLPEKSGRYLVTRKFNALFSLWDKVDILNYSDLMGLKKEKIWWSGNVGKSDFEKFDDVIAWMPLPEPYKIDIESYKAFTELYKIEDIVSPQILNEPERRYLSAVIKPFRDKVRSVTKLLRLNGKGEYIVIDAGFQMFFPDFEANTMYKGMDLGKEYTLEELGL